MWHTALNAIKSFKLFQTNANGSKGQCVFGLRFTFFVTKRQVVLQMAQIKIVNFYFCQRNFDTKGHIGTH